MLLLLSLYLPINSLISNLIDFTNSKEGSTSLINESTYIPEKSLIGFYFRVSKTLVTFTLLLQILPNLYITCSIMQLIFYFIIHCHIFYLYNLSETNKQKGNFGQLPKSWFICTRYIFKFIFNFKINVFKKFINIPHESFQKLQLAAKYIYFKTQLRPISQFLCVECMSIHNNYQVNHNYQKT